MNRIHSITESLASCLILFLISLIATACGSKASVRISVQSSSPSGRFTIQLMEHPRGMSHIDRNFEIFVRNNITGKASKIFSSPDEGPVGGERIFWSPDETRFLLVGPNFYTVPATELSSGDHLYLMYSINAHELLCNATQIKSPRFTLETARRYGLLK